MNSRKENRGRRGGGGQRAGFSHPHRQPPPHLCRNPRAPRCEAAVTSLHKPWQRPQGRAGARRRCSPCLQGH